MRMISQAYQELKARILGIRELHKNTMVEILMSDKLITLELQAMDQEGIMMQEICQEESLLV